MKTIQKTHSSFNVEEKPNPENKKWKFIKNLVILGLAVPLFSDQSSYFIENASNKIIELPENAIKVSWQWIEIFKIYVVNLLVPFILLFCMLTVNKFMILKFGMKTTLVILCIMNILCKFLVAVPRLELICNFLILLL